MVLRACPGCFCISPARSKSEDHAVDGRRCDAEVALQVGLGGWSAHHQRVGINVGQVLALLVGAAATPLPNADLIAACAAFDVLEQAYIEAATHEGPIGSEVEQIRQDDCARIAAKQETLIADIVELRATTPAGHAARARSLLLWEGDDPSCKAAGKDNLLATRQDGVAGYTSFLHGLRAAGRDGAAARRAREILAAAAEHQGAVRNAAQEQRLHAACADHRAARKPARPYELDAVGVQGSGAVHASGDDRLLSTAAHHRATGHAARGDLEHSARADRSAAGDAAGGHGFGAAGKQGGDAGSAARD